MVWFLVSVVVAMSAAWSWFFALRLDAERKENIRLRCEAEVREQVLRDQLSQVLTRQAEFVNTGLLHLDSRRKSARLPQLVPPTPLAPTPEHQNGTAERNLVFFDEDMR